MSKFFNKIIKKRFFMKPYVDKNQCECGGDLKDTGVCYTSMPAQYEYKCEDCGKIVIKPATNINEHIENIMTESTEE